MYRRDSQRIDLIESFKMNQNFNFNQQEALLQHRMWNQHIKHLPSKHSELIMIRLLLVILNTTFLSDAASNSHIEKKFNQTAMIKLYLSGDESTWRHLHGVKSWSNERSRRWRNAGWK